MLTNAIGAFSSAVRVADYTLDDAFPVVDPGAMPTGDKVLVQVRTPKTKTSGGIIIPDGEKDAEKYNTQVAKVVAVGPLCFKDRKTMELWPEGEWFKPGDYVRIPKFGGDRWAVPIPGRPKGEDALFVIFRDTDINGVVTGDPLAMVAYI